MPASRSGRKERWALLKRIDLFPSSAYAKKYTGKYKHKVITGGIGHNLPKKPPEAFAAAILEVDSWAV